LQKAIDLNVVERMEGKMVPLRVLVADDHRLFRQGLIGLMKTRRDLVEVIGEASSGREVVEMTAALHPDVVLMDIQMPDGNGLEATACICQQYPAVTVVMLTASEAQEHLYRAVRLGAAGYLLKDLDADDLFKMLNAVRSGEIVMTPSMGTRLLRAVASPPKEFEGEEALTERELDVLRLVARGASNSQIAEELTISVNTVKVHLRNILDKLRLDNRTQAAAYALRCGLVAAPVGV
jgi:DNA-binding NarL/FixJ family response regulator